MVRMALAAIVLMLSVLLAGCGGAETPGRDPAAPAGDRPTTADDLPEGGDVEIPARAVTVTFEPAEPSLVDMGETGGSGQAEEETEMEGEGSEAPAPGDRGSLATLSEQARQLLAEQIGVTPGEVTMVSAEAVTWPDAALGCPDPEMMYAQVLTPGYRIVLESGGQTYTYHTSERDQLVLCGEDGEPAS